MTTQAGDGPRPLSFPQERLFLLDRIMPGLPAYNVPTLVGAATTLDGERLREAFERVVARHEVLRSAIRLVDGSPVQEISPPGRFELPVYDLRGLPREQAEREADIRLGELVRRPFDLGGDVLLRAALVHLAHDEDLLLVVFHHIGSDHASSGLLFAELQAIYDALGAGREPELPELTIQYADYAQWQREQLTGELSQELVDYWTAQLAGAPERLELPGDRPRPSVQSYAGELLQFTLGAEITGPLKELARREGVSPFMALLAAFSVLLHRYTTAEDLVVGIPVSGRHHEEIAPLLGYFSNTLAIRCDLSGDPTFSELLAQVKATTLEAQIYQQLPFEKLVEALNPQRSQSHSPIFQVLLGYDVLPSAPPRLGGAPLERLPVPGWSYSRFDLSIVVHDRGDGSLHASVEYATDLFDRTTIERLLGHFRTLLDSATREPGARVSALALLDEAQRREMLETWNATTADYDRRPLHELFAEQAARSPDAVAVVSGHDRLTYAELDARANQLAHELRARGIGAGSLVGICVERSVALLVAMFGVLKSGAAYVPIEPTYPPDRQAFMLADAGAGLLISQQQLLGPVTGHGVEVICVDRDWAHVAEHPTSPPPAVSDPEQPAYVIYTSGSTGRPKGVKIRHRSVANLITYMRRRPGIGAGDVLANLTTPAFDLSVPDWYLPLTTGARLVLVPREATLDGVELADWLARTGATFVQATPTTWQLLVDAGWKGSPALKIVCGGEPLSRALADQLRERGASLWHMYGPTETTVWSSIMQLGPGTGALPLGGPIANTTLYVLDTRGEPVPVGVPGELLIGGDGVALGYHKRPELTAEKFVADRFGGRGTLYRTGDLLSWRRDGTLVFHGRIDHQVKLRGFRIELGEIEAVLDSHPEVAASVAVVREDRPGDQRLVAYVVGSDQGAPDTEALRRTLKSKLPPFMVPSAFVVLEAFPVTANGKLNRAALPAPDGARPNLDASFAPPESPVQETLASAWREVLGIDRVGIDDDFFELGGHSLLAVRMLALVQETLGVDLYLGAIFEHPTIRTLSDAVTGAMVRDAGDEDLEELLAELEGSEP